MKLSTTLLFFALLTMSALASDIPSKWLEGVKGFEKAVKLQNETGLPILVWTTWTTCGNCAKVTELIEGSKFKRHLKGSLKVILDAKGKADEVALCEGKSFGGGNFYVLAPADSKPAATVWAWKPGTYQVVDGLSETLGRALTAVKAP